MQKYFVIIVVNIFCLANAFAQNNYDVKLIAPELLPNADVIKRMEEIKIEVKDAGKAIIYHKYALTIMNPGGDDAAKFVEQYDQLINIKDIDGALYDATGKKVKALKNSDVKDISGTSESSLADDNRLKMHDFNCKLYPYTIEYESAIELKGILNFPRWMPIKGDKYAVEKSKLIVQCPLDYKLRFKTFNYAAAPKISTEKQSLIYEWGIEKLPAVEEEKYEPEWYEMTPAVFLAPADFEIQHYAGNMVDWKGFGLFMYQLNLNRDVLPDNIKQQVHQLTDNILSTKEKIKVLYEFMQRNTHYISVQLGIGGWQTFDAAYVATKGYGDCKALSNYMHSLLKEAGIKAYATLVEAGENKNSFLADFPSHQFNHVIICIPQATDTIWLECTSQTMPMGYLGSFTCNRKALLIDEAGGTLVNTPVYKKSDNLQTRKITATVNQEGQLAASIITNYRAEQQDDLHGLLAAVSKDRLSEILKTRFSIPSYDISNFEYKEEKSPLPVITETLALTANNYCAISGKRLFLLPNVLNRSSSKINNAATRKFG
ncbi:MAG: DUF3857 domain-containing protein, partial [Ferruginibacter sp.]|nr:DUF3857 domain-containing protein [Ferruginibacter sp.]